MDALEYFAEYFRFNIITFTRKRRISERDQQLQGYDIFSCYLVHITEEYISKRGASRIKNQITTHLKRIEFVVSDNRKR